MPENWKPALIIGVGGTGVKTLRFIESMAQEDVIPGLNEALKRNHLYLLGFDTDPKSNSDIEDIDPNLVSLFQGSDLSGERLPKKLHRLEHCDFINRHAVNNAVSKLHRWREGHHGELQGNNGEGLDFENTFQWFPKANPKTGDSLTLGHSKSSGAAQWRPLGRLAFFLDSANVYRHMEDAIKAIPNEAYCNSGLNAFVICSLAGGTGSGMFWDLAFFLQMLQADISTTGMFLLSDAFESLDEAGRIHTNTYAALKELVHLKTWRQSIETRYGFSNKMYPIPSRDTIPFDMAYLFRSFSPGQGVTDREKATIDVTCYRIAQNVLGLLSWDLHKEMDVGANNMASDLTANQSSKESGFGFSTCSSMWLNPIEEKDFSPRLEARLFEHCNLAEPEIPIQSVVTELTEHEVSETSDEDNEKSSNPAKQVGFALLSISRNLENMPKRLSEDLITEKPKDIAAISDGLKDAIENLKNHSSKLNLGIAIDDPAKHDHPDWLDFWKKLINANKDENKISRPLSDAFKQKARKHVLRFHAEIYNDIDSLHNILLDKETLDKYQEQLEALVQFRKKEQKEHDDDGLVLEIPGKFFMITNSLKGEVKGKEKAIKAIGINFWRAQVDQILIEVLKSFYKTIDAYFDKKESKAREPLANSLLHPILLERLPDIEKKLESFIKTKREQLAEEEEKHEKAKEALKQIRKKQEQIVEEERLRQKVRNKESLKVRGKDGKLHLFLRHFLPRDDEINLHTWLSQRARTFKICLEQARETCAKEHDNELDYLQHLSQPLLKRIFEEWIDHAHDLADQQDVSDDRVLDCLSRFVSAFTVPSHFQKHDEDQYELIEKMTRLVVDVALGENQPDQAIDKNDANKMIIRMQALAEAYSHFWANCLNQMILCADGDDAFRERLCRSKSRVFKNGMGENRLNRRHLILLPNLPDREEFPEEAAEIRKHYERLSREVMYLKPLVVPTQAQIPLIFHNDMFRAAEEIDRIWDYYQSYASLDKHNRAFYHIHPDIVDFKEIVHNGTHLTVLCGNPSCHFNLAGEHRGKKFCPGCKGPVWNRCGNPTCAADHLKDAILKSTAKVKGKRVIPDNCPVCEEPLHTWWWTCPHHENDPIPADKITCPHCQLEYKQGKRSIDDLGRREDVRGTICHGCRTIGDENASILVPSDLEHCYHNGVNGHDNLLFRERILELSKRPIYQGMGEHYCSNKLKRHLLFPTCPLPKHRESQSMHLYRLENGRFICPEHNEHPFYDCARCGYPIHDDGTHEHTCPRCWLSLRKCFYCSDREGKFFTPRRVDGDARCDNCSNVMSGRQGWDPGEGLFEPAYCRNLPSCIAAANPFKIQAESELGHCRVCSTGFSALLPASLLKGIVERCPLCSHLFPEGINQPNLKEILDRFKKGSDQSQTGQEPCINCGWHRVDLIDWMKKDLENNEQSTNNISYSMYVDFLNILRENQDPITAFRALRKSFNQRGKMCPDQKWFDDMYRLSKGKTWEVSIRRRLDELHELTEEFLARVDNRSRNKD